MEKHFPKMKQGFDLCIASKRELYRVSCKSWTEQTFEDNIAIPLYDGHNVGLWHMKSSMGVGCVRMSWC